jgi:hypothetical protein
MGKHRKLGETMKKISYFILIILTLVFSVACQKEDTGIKLVEKTTYHEPYRSETYEVGSYEKSYIVNRQGIPELVLSSEIRLDIIMLADQLTIEEIEPYFAIAKETGLNTVDLPFIWKWIENEKDVYDTTIIHQLLDYAKAYDLKVNLIWYGSFVDGESRTGLYPEYIAEDEETYPILLDLYDFGIFGRVKIMDWTDQALLERESLAIYELMNAVYDWNMENNRYDPLMMVQIGQGLDRFPRWRISQYEVLGDDGILLTQQEGWDIVEVYIEHIAKAINLSAYRPLVRVEFTEQNGVTSYVTSIKDIAHVDLVSPTYLHSIANAKTGMRNFVQDLSDMPIYNAQNWADDMNHKNMLATIALGAFGFNSYQLSAAEFYPEPPNGALYDRIDRTASSMVLMFTQKNQRVDMIKPILLGLDKAYMDVLKTPRQNFMVLGMDTRIPFNSEQYLYTQSGLLFSYSNPTDGLGFVIQNDQYVTVFATKDASITFSNVIFINATEGYYGEDGNWVNEGSVSLSNNNLTLNVTGQKVYRLRISTLQPLPTNLDEIYTNSFDAIRG